MYPKCRNTCGKLHPPRLSSTKTITQPASEWMPTKSTATHPTTTRNPKQDQTSNLRTSPPPNSEEALTAFDTRLKLHTPNLYITLLKPYTLNTTPKGSLKVTLKGSLKGSPKDSGRRSGKFTARSEIPRSAKPGKAILRVGFRVQGSLGYWVQTTFRVVDTFEF